MMQTSQLAVLTVAASLCMSDPLAAQSFRLDPIKYDRFGGLVTLGWQSQPGGIYSVHTSTNLIVWDEFMGVGNQALRIPAASGNRTQVELEVPQGDHRFWRVGRRPITDLGTLTPDSFYYPALHDLNDDSRVAGYFTTGDGDTIGFTCAPGEEVLSFGSESSAVAVNNSGTVVGSRSGRFFSWTKSGGLVELGAGGAVDVNNAGHILGVDVSGAFLWKPGVGKIRIPHLSSVEPYTVPEALSDAGHVVGVSLINGDYYRAFLWTEAGGLVDLTVTLSTAASGAIDVNTNGQVVGHRVLSSGESRAFSWTATGGFVTFPAGCYITDLSEKGKVVGRGYLNGHAFSWTQSGGIIDLGIGGSPEKVNELGQTVGYLGTSAVLWSTNGVQTELEALSSQQSTANLINNKGVVFGISQPQNALARHVVMWTTNPTP
jgi:probable HAF family extracellular repeat protein